MEKHIVQSTSLFEVDDSFEDNRFMKVRVTALHSGLNRNNSRFDLKVIKAAKDSFANIPILAEVKEYTDENGNTKLDYTTHAMHVEEDAFNEGEARIIYDEKVVGIVPETNNFEIVHDDDTGNDYVLVDALLFRDYGNYCCDILEERGGKTDVSAEIACDDVAFSAKDKCIDVGKMRMCAITLLGAETKPGMAKAHAEVFSSNEDDRTSQLIQIMQELKESLDNYKNLQEGGNQTMTKFEELLGQYNKTVEEIEFEYEGLTDEELEAAFAEAFSSNGEDEGDAAEPEAPASEEFDNADPESTEDENDEEETHEETPNEFNVKYSMTYGENVKEFAISLSDKIYAIQTLVNDTYAELDNDWYYCDVYEEEGYAVMHGWSRSYRQAFKCKKGQYSLVGDRIEVYAQWLTQDEITKLESMKTNYSSIETELAEKSEKLQKYEEEPQKTAILEAQKYSYVAGTAEFEELKNNHFDLSVDEVTTKANDILLQYAESGALKFSAEQPEQKVERKSLLFSDKKTSRYGNLFSK